MRFVAVPKIIIDNYAQTRSYFIPNSYQPKIHSQCSLILFPMRTPLHHRIGILFIHSLFESAVRNTNNTSIDLICTQIVSNSFILLLPIALWKTKTFLAVFQAISPLNLYLRRANKSNFRSSFILTTSTVRDNFHGSTLALLVHKLE